MIDTVVAPFVPSTAELLTSSSNQNLLTENPLLASALSQIFPYLLLIDNALEIATWTNEDPFENLLLVIGYSVVCIYWGVVSRVFLPLMIAFTFCSVVWRTNSVLLDSRKNEKPTVDEVVNTLNNITVRVEMMLRPMKHFRVGRRQISRMLVAAIVLTPVHWLLLNTVLSVRRFVWVLGVLVLTYHSPWSFSVRRLIWRSVYVRVAAFYITGLDVSADKKRQQQSTSRSITASRIPTPSTSDIEDMNSSIPLLSGFKIIKKVISSSTQLKQVVLFEILENERRWFGLGWSHFLLPGDRPNFCYVNNMEPAPPVDYESSDDFPFPVFAKDLYSYHWNWIEPNWKIEPAKTDDGWVYHDSKWENDSPKDGFSQATRTRKWTRRAELLIDKEHTVMDGK
ncbi:peroxisomal membrane protein Pex32p [Diutina catenulata]